MANLTAERPSHAFIESDRVEGSAVYRSNGDQIGTIERLIIEKVSGKVAYAIMGFGGFLGIGEDHYPVPWSLLQYNTNLGGYEVNLSDAQLKAAPKFAHHANWEHVDHKRVHDYYDIRPPWY